MLYFADNNIWNAPKGVVLTVPVNTVGVLGKGLAKQFKLRFPHLEAEYKEACQNGCLTIGRRYYVFDFVDNVSICLFPTKAHWRSPSRLEWIEAGLKGLAYRLANVTPAERVALPPLGCGLGGLAWTDVHALMQKHLAAFGDRILIFPPKEGR